MLENVKRGYLLEGEKERERKGEREWWKEMRERGKKRRRWRER